MITSLLIAFLLLCFTGLTWHNQKFALIAVLALLPTYLLRFSIGPLPSTVLEGFIIIATVGWLARGGAQHVPTLKPVAIPAALLLVASIIGIFAAPNILDALGIWRAYILEPLIMFAMLATTFEKNDWRNAGIALTASGIVVAIFGIVQWCTGLGIPAPWDIERRITSVFDYPNALGLFVAPITAAILAWRGKSTRTLLFAVPMIVAIVFAQTEAALVAIPIALLLTLWLTPTLLRTKIIATISIAIVFFFAFTRIPAVQEKILLNDLSGQARIAMWKETHLMLADSPIVGAGISGFPTAIAPYHDATYFEIFQYPHNIFLNIWTELGVLGLFVFLIIAILVIRATWQQRNDPMALAVFAALATMCIHGLVDVPFFKNDLAIMTAALLAYLATKKVGASHR